MLNRGNLVSTMNGKRVQAWDWKDCSQNWHRPHTYAQILNTESDSMPKERQKLDSTRWAWPPVDRGDSNTSVQWSTVACHQVVFACAFGAVSTTPGEACCSNMKTGATIILLSAHLLGAMTLENNNSIGLIEVHLSMMACKSHVHMHDTRNFYLFWFVMLSREHVCSLDMLESPIPANEKSRTHTQYLEPCKQFQTLKAPSTCIIL